MLAPLSRVMCEVLHTSLGRGHLFAERGRLCPRRNGLFSCEREMVHATFLIDGL
jgi:hypothetical protein